MRKWPVVLACLLTVCGNAAAQDGCPDARTIPGYIRGSMTGQECLNLAEAGSGYLEVYMRGFVDGLFVSTFAGASLSCVESFHQCFTGRTSGQLAAVLEKWLRENPSHWHEPCNMLAWMAIIRDMCGISQGWPEKW